MAQELLYYLAVATIISFVWLVTTGHRPNGESRLTGVLHAAAILFLAALVYAIWRGGWLLAAGLGLLHALVIGGLAPTVIKAVDAESPAEADDDVVEEANSEGGAVRTGPVETRASLSATRVSPIGITTTKTTTIEDRFPGTQHSPTLKVQVIASQLVLLNA